MSFEEIEQRLQALELFALDMGKKADDLNETVIRLNKENDRLKHTQKMLQAALSEVGVKPLSEETPPPHY